MGNCLWCYYRRLTTSLVLKKCKKECNIYSLNNSGIQGFCPLKIKITQFPSGFHLNVACLIFHLSKPVSIRWFLFITEKHDVRGRFSPYSSYFNCAHCNIYPFGLY